MKKKLVVLSGAGISAESGVKTFRDSNGLWENHRIEDVASPEGFERNPQMVLDFYNARRKALKKRFIERVYIQSDNQEFNSRNLEIGEFDDLEVDGDNLLIA